MSVRATLDVEPAGLADSMQHQAQLAGAGNQAARSGLAASSPSSSAESSLSTFRDRWQALLASLESGDAQFETGEKGSNPIDSSAMQGARGGKQRFVPIQESDFIDVNPPPSQLPPGFNPKGSTDRETAKLVRRGAGPFGPITAESNRRAKPSADHSETTAAVGADRKTLHGQSVNNAANPLSVASVVNAVPIPPPTVIARSPRDTSSTPINAASSDPLYATPSSVTSGNDAAVGHGPISTGASATTATQPSSSPGLPGADRARETAQTPADVEMPYPHGSSRTVTGSQADNGALSNRDRQAQLESGSDQSLKITGARQSLDATADFSIHSGSDPLASGQTSLRLDAKQAAENRVHPQEPVRQVVQSIDANSTSTLPSHQPLPFDANRDAVSAKEPDASLQHANLPEIAGVRRVLKSTSPKLSSTGRPDHVSHSQPAPFSSFTSVTFGDSRIAEITPAGIAFPKGNNAASGSLNVEATFAALESGTVIDTTTHNASRTIHAQAEAGYQDPSLGWIGIRAESSGGEIHATVVSPSSEAAHALSGHMAGLQTYLADNRTPVDTLTLASTSGNGGQLTGQDSGQGMRHGAGQQPGQGDSTDLSSGMRQFTRRFPENTMHSSSTTSDAVPTNALSNARGGQISVVV